MRKGVLLFVTSLALTFQTFAGLKWAEVGVNGLTCSMCTRSVEMSLRRLDFVDSVSMSLEATEGKIYFKPNTLVNLHQVAKAVVDAGFSVRFVKLHISFDDISLQPDGSFVFQGQSYRWHDYPKNVKGVVALQLVNDNFLPRKESAAWKKKIEALKTSDEKILHVVQKS